MCFVQYTAGFPDFSMQDWNICKNGIAIMEKEP